MPPKTPSIIPYKVVESHSSESVVMRKFTLFHKVQAYLGLFSILFLSFSSSVVVSQEVIPQLQTQEYNRSLMNQIYGQYYFQNSLVNWSDQIDRYIGILKSSWERDVDEANIVAFKATGFP